MKNSTTTLITLLALAGVTLAGGTATTAFAGGPKAVGELCLNPDGNCPKPLGPFVGFPVDLENPPAPPAPPANPGFGNVGAAIVGGFVAGAIINSMNQPKPTVIVQQPQYVQPVQPVQTSGNLQAHIQDCQRRYKTYDISTNSFMSNAGYRKPCYSSFM